LDHGRVGQTVENQEEVTGSQVLEPNSGGKAELSLEELCPVILELD